MYVGCLAFLGEPQALQAIQAQQAQQDLVVRVVRVVLPETQEIMP